MTLWMPNRRRRLMRLGEFGIDELAHLFGPTDNGLLFDNLAPSYKKNGFNILYKDQAGTPVSADGQSAALMLDRSNGLKLGSDLWTGGTATGTSGYQTYDATTGFWTINRDANGIGSVVGPSLIANTTYVFDMDVEPSGPGAGHQAYIAVSGGGSLGYTFTTSQRVKMFFRPTASGTVTFACPNSNYSWGFKVYSIKALLGNHALQTTAASQMTAKSGTPWYLSADGGDYYTTPLVPGSELVLAVCFNATGSSTTIGSRNSDSSQNAYLNVSSGGVPNFSWGSSGATGTGNYLNQNVVLLGRGNSSRRELWVNGSLAIATTTGSFSAPSYPLVLWGINAAGSLNASSAGKLFRAFAINRYVTDAEVQTITKALAKDVVTL